MELYKVVLKYRTLRPRLESFGSNAPCEDLSFNFRNAFVFRERFLIYLRPSRTTACFHKGCLILLQVVLLLKYLSFVKMFLLNYHQKITF